MKIKVEIDVPEGKYCNYCRSRKHFHKKPFQSFCGVFDIYLKYLTSKINWKKCPACLKACADAEKEK